MLIPSLQFSNSKEATTLSTVTNLGSISVSFCGGRVGDLVSLIEQP